MKVYGPYLFKSGACKGRRYVTLINDHGERRNILYSRPLMEEHLGRQFSPSEHVDHVDDDKTNDVIGNLQILTASQNAMKSHAACGPASRTLVTCDFCGRGQLRLDRIIRANAKKGRTKMFCDRACSRRWQVSNTALVV